MNDIIDERIKKIMKNDIIEFKNNGDINIIHIFTDEELGINENDYLVSVYKVAAITAAVITLML